MVRSSKEKVLLYQFRDASLLAQVQQILHELQISVQLLPEDAWVQKIGYLLGLRGFHQQELSNDGFVFPHEVMLLHNIKNKRLDQVLQAFHKAQVPSIRYKAIVTPFNTLWTLRRLCETMQKEHAALMARENHDEA